MKFRKKPVVIEAMQWFPGADVEGVEQQNPELVFSAGETHYYLSAMGHPKEWRMADSWLPVDPNAENERSRSVLPFAFWNVKDGKRVAAEASDPLVLRYIEHMGWPSLPEPYGIVTTLEGRMAAMPGDWIITGVKGELYPCKPDIFEATYDPAT